MQHAWLALGWFFVALGAIGALLPVVPTVPFLLIAAWAFSKSSPRLMYRILSHPRYGPPVRAWQERGVIGPFAKTWAVVAMAGGVVFSWFIGMPDWLVAAQATACLGVAAFIVTRPTY